MPVIPQSEVLTKFVQEIREKCREILANIFADFRPSISRENGRKQFNIKKILGILLIKFFHSCNSGG